MQNNFYLFYIENYCDKINFLIIKKKQYKQEVYLNLDENLINKFKVFYYKFIHIYSFNLVNLKYTLLDEMRFTVSAQNPKYIIDQIQITNRIVNELEISYQSYYNEWQKYANNNDLLSDKQMKYKPNYNKYKKYKHTIDKKRTIMLSKILNYKITGKRWWIIAIVCFLISLCLILTIALH